MENFTHVTAEPTYGVQTHVHTGLMLHNLHLYTCDKLGMQSESFAAPIGTTNMRNIALFASLGFRIVCTVSI